MVMGLTSGLPVTETDPFAVFHFWYFPISVPISESKVHSFEWLIAPLTPEDFFTNYYEKQVCRVIRTDRSYYHDLLSTKVLDLLLQNQNLTTPKTRMANANAELNAELYSHENIINVAKFTKLFADGYTAIFSGLNERLPELRLLCDNLSKYFSHRYQTNIYYTPGRAQGFKVHYDTHDVFILQVEGSKLWRFYESPLALPLKKLQDYEATEVKPGALTDEFILNAGDMIYIPRGIMHEAISTDDPSLHITTGLLGITWADFLTDRILEVAMKNEDLRKNIPVGIARKDFDFKAANDRFQKLLKDFTNEANFQDGAENFIDLLISEQQPLMPERFHQLSLVPRISLNSQARKLSNLIFKVRSNGDKAALSFCDQEVQFPEFAKPALDFITDKEVFSVKDLPDVIDDEGKLVLVKRLVKEGFLEILQA